MAEQEEDKNKIKYKTARASWRSKILKILTQNNDSCCFFNPLNSLHHIIQPFPIEMTKKSMYDNNNFVNDWDSFLHFGQTIRSI